MTEQQTAFIHCMVLMSAADSNMTDKELETIISIITHLPAFRGYDHAGLSAAVDDCLALLGHENGIDIILDKVKSVLPVPARETAYALAVEVAAADLSTSQEELTLLQFIRQKLDLDRLICTGIERGARARYAGT